MIKKIKELTDRIAMECSINLLNNYEALPSSNSQIDFPWLANNINPNNIQESINAANEFINFLLESERKRLVSEGKSAEEIIEILNNQKNEVLSEFKLKL
ncbi:hypothetical protein [Mycoplasma sp. 2575]